MTMSKNVSKGVKVVVSLAAVLGLMHAGAGKETPRDAGRSDVVAHPPCAHSYDSPYGLSRADLCEHDNPWVPTS